jgi:ribonuclease-3
MLNIKIEQTLGYKFKNKSLLATALTHKSFQFENRHLAKEYNERLEFLGDAVLDLVLGEVLLKRFNLDDEGGLSKKRASLVNEAVLAQMAKDISLDKFILLGKGEILSGGASRPRLLSCAFEALLGAIHLDGGYIAAYEFIEKLYEFQLTKISTEIDFQADYKTRLQEMVQKEKKPTPVYHMLEETGPSHDKDFIVEVEIFDLPKIKGIGKSKKSAEQNAAKIAIETYSVFFTSNRGEK